MARTPKTVKTVDNTPDTDDAIYAMVRIGYQEIMLPIDDAHTIQKLIAKSAVHISDRYSASKKKSFYITTQADIPQVVVVRHKDIIFDCTSMDIDMKTKYIHEVVEPYLNGDSDTYITPEAYTKLS